MNVVVGLALTAYLAPPGSIMGRGKDILSRIRGRSQPLWTGQPWGYGPGMAEIVYSTHWVDEEQGGVFLDERIAGLFQVKEDRATGWVETGCALLHWWPSLDPHEEALTWSHP